MPMPIQKVLVFGQFYRCAPPNHLGYADIRGVWSISYFGSSQAAVFSNYIDKIFVEFGFPVGSYLKDVYDYAWEPSNLEYAIEMANDYASNFDWLTGRLTLEQLKPRDLAEFVARHRRDL